MSSEELFPQAIRDELSELPRPHPSFLVSLLTREEPAIQSFRDQIAAWWAHIREEARERYQAELQSLENDVFFQAFGELAVHEILRYHDIGVEDYAKDPAGWMTMKSGDGGEFGLSVISYLPEVQIRGSMSVYRHLVRELNQIHHHYAFSVYLKRWLPYDFDPRPIKRALEVWLDSLDDGSWHGKYAEYRDENIHLEFSILDKLNEDRRNLVRFRISPLRAPDVLERVVDCVDQLCAGLPEESDRPMVATVFSNEDWALPDSFLADFLYGKPDYHFTWTTHGGRTERLKTFQRSSAKYGVFVGEQYEKISAVVMADKEWERDKVVFSLRVLHNPWAAKPLPPGYFGQFAQYRPIDRDGEEIHLAWNNQHRTRFRLP